MSNIQVVESKISSIRKYLKLLERYKTYEQKEIENNPDLKGAFERYLYLAAQATIDLAEAVIAFKDFRRPTTYSDAFYVLDQEGFLAKELSEKLINMAKFRNIIAHDYEDVDFKIVYDAGQNRLVDIKQFIAVVRERFNLG
ncbi:MAG TPA: DUF86 domain-containing protein [Candidatus Paceibacterota bacterium]